MPLNEAARAYGIEEHFVTLIRHDRLDPAAVPPWHRDVFLLLDDEDCLTYLPWLHERVPAAVQCHTFCNVMFPEPCRKSARHGGLLERRPDVRALMR